MPDLIFVEELFQSNIYECQGRRRQWFQTICRTSPSLGGGSVAFGRTLVRPYQRVVLSACAMLADNPTYNFLIM
jgi:hypothetical protein